jgi:hypothetical protein
MSIAVAGTCDGALKVPWQNDTIASVVLVVPGHCPRCPYVVGPYGLGVRFMELCGHLVRVRESG